MNIAFFQIRFSGHRLCLLKSACDMFDTCRHYRSVFQGVSGRLAPPRHNLLGKIAGFSYQCRKNQTGRAFPPRFLLRAFSPCFFQWTPKASKTKSLDKGYKIFKLIKNIMYFCIFSKCPVFWTIGRWENGKIRNEHDFSSTVWSKLGKWNCLKQSKINVWNHPEPFFEFVSKE